MPSRVVAAVRTEEPASWAASAPALPSSQGGAASTTNASGNSNTTAHCSAVTLSNDAEIVLTAHFLQILTFINHSYKLSVFRCVSYCSHGLCLTLLLFLSFCRSCGLIPHGEWVQKGCSYCRCGYGMLHCFPHVFHKDCGKMHTPDTRPLFGVFL